ncbi:MAG: hypothetical protein ACTTJH_08135 [Bacteroidales bacterium]
MRKVSYAVDKKYSLHPMFDIIMNIGNPDRVMVYHYNSKSLVIYQGSDSLWNFVLIEVVKNYYTIDNVDIDLIIYKKENSLNYHIYGSLFSLCKKEIINIQHIYINDYYSTSSQYSVIGYKNFDYVDIAPYPFNIEFLYTRKRFGHDYGGVTDIISLVLVNILQSLEELEIEMIYNTDNLFYMYDWNGKSYY